MFESDFQFPHSYQVSDPPEFPGSGKSNIPLHNFPNLEKRPERDGLWIRIRPQIGEEWIGVFACPSSGPPAISKVLSTPDPNRVCVISGGQGYLVHTSKPSEWEIVPLFPVTNASSIVDCQFLLFASLSRIVGWNAGIVWEADLALDGLTITNVSSEQIEGYGYDPVSNTNDSFVIDTPTGKVHD
jgi:hypothetical protein